MLLEPGVRLVHSRARAFRSPLLAGTPAANGWRLIPGPARCRQRRGADARELDRDEIGDLCSGRNRSAGYGEVAHDEAQLEGDLVDCAHRLLLSTAHVNGFCAHCAPANRSVTNRRQIGAKRTSKNGTPHGHVGCCVPTVPRTLPGGPSLRVPPLRRSAAVPRRGRGRRCSCDR